MPEHPYYDDRHDDRPIAADAGDLFAWRGEGIVLFAERVGDRWVVARGWRAEDRLVHVRRWFFPTAQALAGQVRRLVHEVTGETTHSVAAATAALAWAGHQGDPAESGHVAAPSSEPDGGEAPVRS